MSDHFDGVIRDVISSTLPKSRMSEQRHTKASADYSQGNMQDHCSVCTHYLGPKTTQNCTEIDGHVAPNMWCKFFDAARHK